NGDGKITSGAELFGTSTKLSSGEFAADGYEALSDLDDNGDLFLTSEDAAFAELLVWQDANANGVSEEGEIFTLEDMQIVALSLQTERNFRHDNGNWMELQSSYTTASGEQKLMADVWFVTAPLPV
ncbi:MAG: hypothetical protein ACO24G_10085, partial [Burkholderiaceae bacterium]